MIFTIYLKNGNTATIEGVGINITTDKVIIAGEDRLITAEFEREAFAGYVIEPPKRCGAKMEVEK